VFTTTSVGVVDFNGEIVDGVDFVPDGKYTKPDTNAPLVEERYDFS
jgi:hypothetical protein